MGSRKIAVLCGVLALVMVVAYGCATGPMLPYEAAKQLEKKGDYAGAVEQYKQHMEEYPDSMLNAYAAWRSAKCYEKLGDKDAALKAYDAVVKDYPDSKPAEWAKEDKDYLEKHPELVLPPKPEEPVVEEKAPEVTEAKPAGEAK